MSTKRTKVFIQSELKELIPRFLEVTLERLESIQEKLNERSFEDIARTSHKMAGSGGGYGFEEISRLGKSLEQAALEGKAETIRNLADKLNEYMRSIEIEYR